MKFRWKIFSLCMLIYLITMAFTAVIVSNRTYESLLDYEIKRSLEEERNIHNSITLYLLVNLNDKKEKVNLENYSTKIVDMFSSKNNFIDIFSRDGKLLSSSSPEKWNFNRDEIITALSSGRPYIMRWHNNRHYLFISDQISIGDEQLLLSYSKDITHIDNQKKDQYIFFGQAGILGLILIILITTVLSNLIMSPINNLIHITKGMASGNYNNRIHTASMDEIGILGAQFNIMAAEIQRKVSELQEESEKKQRFIDNLTHELRTPLTSIIGYSELLKGIKYDEVSFNKGLNYINSEGKRMLSLTTTLMDLILLRKHTLTIERHSILNLLHEIAGIMSIKSSDKNITLIIDSKDFKLSFDRDMLKTALINLIDNAIKASYEGGKIVLGSEVDSASKTYSIFVKDEGKGIDKTEIPNILEPFYRVDKSRSRKGGGLGLGLSIVKSILDAHGFKLSIESEFGLGTSAAIIFPPQGGDFIE